MIMFSLMLHTHTPSTPNKMNFKNVYSKQTKSRLRSINIENKLTVARGKEGEYWAKWPKASGTHRLPVVE